MAVIMMVSSIHQSCEEYAYNFSSTKCQHFKSLLILGFLLSLLLICFNSHAGSSEQAKRIYERLTGTQPHSLLSDLYPADELIGVDPDLTVFDALVEEIDNTDGADADLLVGNNDGVTGAIGAAMIAMEDDNFYRVTLKNWVAPWTNREHEVFVSLNDYIATVMGYVRDDRDFRGILSENVLYTAQDGTPGVSETYSPANNTHYEQFEATDPDVVNLKASLLRNSGEADGVDPITQASLLGIPAEATAGVITSRAASEAFFVDGTNRAMLRYTLINHMCVDLEQMQDATLPPDRVRQDVSRSPGGDSRVYSNTCVTCHGGLDPMAQAFAYYDYDNDGILNEDGTQAVAATNRLVYNDGSAPDINEKTNEVSNQPDPRYPFLQQVQRKYHINETTFPFGYRTVDDGWSNYWRTGVNRSLGWSGDDGTVFSGSGAKSLGEELANSEAFAQCQVKKVFQAVCLRDPIDTDDLAALSSITTSFKTNGQLKQTFASVANHCKGN